MKNETPAYSFATYMKKQTPAYSLARYCERPNSCLWLLLLYMKDTTTAYGFWESQNTSL